MNPETTYLKHLATIERIAAFVARKAHLSADDTAEFVQIVRVALWENDYAIIRKFEGRSTFTTYLTTVIVRRFHQWRVEQWGKWRPSAEARRIGDLAITLERLTTRDGFTFTEAVKVLTTRAGAVSVTELEAIYVRLPNRPPRPMEVSGEVPPDAATVESDAGTRIESRDRERTVRVIVQTLDAVVQTFDPEDRLILELRFWNACKVPEIARTLGLDQKKLYKRLDKLYAILRRALEAAGVSRADIEAVLGSGDQDIHLNVLSDPKKPPSGPSNEGGEGE